MQKIKVSLVGYGYWGPKLARNFQNSNFFNLVSIIDNSINNLKKAKKDFPLAKVSANYADILKNPSISLVVVASPTKTHFKIAKFALENKKNVLVEKPLSSSLNEVKKLEKLAKKNSTCLFVDYPFLFSGSIKYVKKIIENKTYGKLMSIESFREQAPVRKDCNVIWDLAVHDISILNYILKGKPRSFSSLKIKMTKQKLVDTAYLNLLYDNDINVFLKSTWISPEKIRLIKLTFAKAIVYCDENEPVYKIKIFKRKNEKNSKYSLEIPEIDLSEPLSVLVEYIYQSINTSTNKIFENNLNQNVTKILKKLS
tara:strand:+ start:5252 stop:6187 length:936 start_codon:yes stop_codon:yes gene_type:complete